MDLTNPDSVGMWPDYQHLHFDDQPHLSFNGLTAENQLWLQFHNERVLRAVAQHLRSKGFQDAAAHLQTLSPVGAG